MILKAGVDLRVHFVRLHSSAFRFKIGNSGQVRKAHFSAVITFRTVGNSMRDWYVGQKIVCVDAQPIGGLRNRFVDQHLREGKIYKIRHILVFRFMSGDKREERLAFRLEGIVPHLIKGTEYAFFHGRFRPLEPGGEDEDIDISIFLDGLAEVNRGLVRFPAPETPELEPVEGGRVRA
jgi:hypothetical protein